MLSVACGRGKLLILPVIGYKISRYVDIGINGVFVGVFHSDLANRHSERNDEC